MSRYKFLLLRCRQGPSEDFLHGGSATRHPIFKSKIINGGKFLSRYDDL
jgi:hypothetical protein